MPNYDLQAAFLAAALEERLRFHDDLERNLLGIAPQEYTSQRQQRDAQRRWLRESLERDTCPSWLIEMVVAQWVYVPEWEWE